HFFTTVSVSGCDGNCTVTFCFCRPEGSLLYWNCACPRKTIVYTPGGRFGLTSTTTLPSVLSAAMVSAGCGGWFPCPGRPRTVTCTGALKSGQLRASFKGTVSLSPGLAVASVRVVVSVNGPCSVTANTTLASNRLMVGPCWFCG